MSNNIVVFDGDCGFCNKTIMFIAKNNKTNSFIFVSSLSDYGVNLLSKYQMKGVEKSTIILIEKNTIFIKSIAIRRILLKIPFYKIVGYLIFLFPQKTSDYIYDIISKNRKLISKNNTCEIPNAELRKKFII